MISKHYVEGIIKCFTSMDIEKLRLHLKDEYSYEETTKEVFLREIEKIFRRFKNAGDTELIIYKGKCGGKTCPNCGKKGYRFVGNHTKNYLDLLFETEGDDITDINSCALFKTDEKIKKLNYPHEIDVNEDEKVSFVKTPEYRTKLNAATTAWNEIITSPPRKMDFQDLSYWIAKHAVAYQLIKDDDPFDQPMNWTPFISLYADLKDIRNYLSQNMDKISNANAAMQNNQTEEELIDWLLKYEDVGDDAPFFIKYDFFKNEGDYFRWNYQNPVHFKDDVFSQAIRFHNYYLAQHKKMLNKFTTYTSEEASIQYNFCGTKEETKRITSLSFHLQNRKELEIKGIFVPLWIDEMHSEN